VLSRGLPPEGFSAGDPGIKLIAARQAIAHPDRPFEIDLPAIAGTPTPFVDPLYKVHGDHAHALQSPLFPLVSAPPLAWLGLRGAISAVLACPVFFYAFEIWEHVPAMAASPARRCWRSAMSTVAAPRCGESRPA
jgi:hypothetical protein